MSGIRRSVSRIQRRSIQRAEVLRNVDRVRLQYGQIDHFQCAGIGCGKHHRRRDASLVRLNPPLSNDAPAITGLQPRESVLRHGSDQVIPDAALMIKKLRRHYRADQVACLSRPTTAATVAIKAGERIRAARLKFGAKHIRFTIHSTSLAWIG